MNRVVTSLRRPSRGAGWAAVLLTGVLASGCSAPTGPAAPGPPVTELRVGLTEWSVAVPPNRLRAGPVQLDVLNAGATAHDLAVRVLGGPVLARTALLAPGRRQTLRLVAPPHAVLELWCTVTGHRAAGMRAMVPTSP